MEGQTINCTISQNLIICNGTEYEPHSPPLTFHDGTFWIYLVLYIVLVLFAGLMSGLTLGLLSLDMTSLRVVQVAGSDKDKKYAGRILPIVKRHHLLLVTLLLANAVAVETMPIFLDRISDPLTAILVSVTAVLLFGEVFPQALCSRYGLAIGYVLSPLVYVLMVVCFVIAYPISKLLDCMLGQDHATFFRRAELKALVDLHGPEGVHGGDELTYDEVLIIKGALELRDKTVQDAMVPLENVFMLDIETTLDKSGIHKLLRAAHSRVPVYEGDRHNVISVLLVKTLICLDSQANISVRSLVQDTSRHSRNLHVARATMPLYDLLNEFQKGKSHLAFVTKSSPGSSVENSWLQESNQRGRSMKAATGGIVCGIITLEDVLEELLQEEIIDETDVYVDVRNRVKVARAKTFISRSMSMHTDSSIVTDTTTGSRYRSILQPAFSHTGTGQVNPGPEHHDGPTNGNNRPERYDRSQSDNTPLLS